LLTLFVYGNRKDVDYYHRYHNDNTNETMTETICHRTRALHLKRLQPTSTLLNTFFIIMLTSYKLQGWHDVHVYRQNETL